MIRVRINATWALAFLSVTCLAEPQAPSSMTAGGKGLFIENKGQWDSAAQFLCRTPGVNQWLTTDGMVFDFNMFHSGRRINEKAPVRDYPGPCRQDQLYQRQTHPGFRRQSARRQVQLPSWQRSNQPEPIFYGKEHFERFRELAAAIEIEEDLTQLREGSSSDGACVRVRNYPAYTIVVNRIGNRLVMAPDQKGRALAAVFTSEDACDAFLDEASKQSGTQLEPLTYCGKDLFELLSRMDLTGIVFNCSGPTSPVAFAAAFSQVILEA